MSVLPNLEINHLRSLMERMSQEGEGEAGPNAPGTWCPAVDVFEDANEILLHAELPGMTKQDIDIQINASTLKLSGERKPLLHKQGSHFRRIERSYGAFSRVFAISAPIDITAVSATYEAGILTVRLPKSVVESRQIAINSR